MDLKSNTTIHEMKKKIQEQKLKESNSHGGLVSAIAQRRMSNEFHGSDMEKEK